MDVQNGFGYDVSCKHDSLRRSKRLKRQSDQATQPQMEDALPRAKRKKANSRRRIKPKPRKNRPHENINRMSLQCCTEKTCLLNYDRGILASIRKDFDGKLYDEQNSYLNSLIEVEPKERRNRITYHIKDVSGLRKVKVCKMAFLKIFGIGKKRITVLLKKIQPYSGDIQRDQRPLNRNAKKLQLSLKAEVVEHIRSYERQPSHYARETTQERQFLSSNLTIAHLWRDFLDNKGIQEGEKAPISYTTFRNIFRTFNLSFRKPYVDTCGRCDSFGIIIKYSKDEDERDSARDLKSAHIEKADEHYDFIHFDLNVLPKEKNKQNARPWLLPPRWK